MGTSDGTTSYFGIYAFAVDPSTGLLSPQGDSPVLNVSEGGGFAVAGLSFTPDGAFALVQLESATNITAPGAIGVYQVNPSTGVWTQVANSPYASDAGGPAAITIDPTGRFVYSSNSYLGNVSAFTFDSTNGALAPIAGSPFATGVGLGGMVTN